MIPVKFKGSNVIFGEGQDEYEPLPSLRLPDGTVITCWQMTDKEFEEIKKTRQIFLKQLTFGQRLQPVQIITDLSEGII